MYDIVNHFLFRLNINVGSYTRILFIHFKFKFTLPFKLLYFKAFSMEREN